MVILSLTKLYNLSTMTKITKTPTELANDSVVSIVAASSGSTHYPQSDGVEALSLPRESFVGQRVQTLMGYHI